VIFGYSRTLTRTTWAKKQRKLAITGFFANRGPRVPVPKESESLGFESRSGLSVLCRAVVY
jgi:hypothetical protein